MNANDNFQYEYFSSVHQRKVEWLWYPYIPYGKITILQGDPGEGKSTFILNIAALLSRGKDMPDGYSVKSSQYVIYQTAEDNVADTVKPHLVSAGADCNKIAYIIDDEASLNLDDPRIEKIIQSTKAKLFILDPLQAYLSHDSDFLSAGRMRQKLKKIADIAAKYKCAIVIIGHMNKSSGEKNIYRGLGSIDITAIARSVLMITRDETDSSIRYMFPVKSSLAPEGEPIAFKFERKGLVWIGKGDFNINRDGNYSNKENKFKLAKRLIKEMLEYSDLPSKDILHRLKLSGISERTANKAKSELSIFSCRKNGIWYWSLDNNSQDKESSNYNEQ